MNYKIKLLIVLLLIGTIFVANKMSWQGEDFSIFSIDGEKVEMINISPSRGMINVYELKDFDIWIPNGMGWYPVSRLGLIVKNDKELIKKISFYNFGFWPKEVTMSGGWNNNKYLFSILGPVGFVRYQLSFDDWLWRSGNLKNENLAEIIPRDMSDSQIVSADIKLNIVNASGKNGFGNMIADRLEYWGLVVTSVQTGNIENKCQIMFDYSLQNKNILDNLADIMKCDKVNRPGLVELILGSESEEMIKYSQTYVRAL